MHLYERIGGNNALKRKSRLAVKISQVVGDIFEMPSESVPGGMTFTVTDCCELYMSGCREILAYENCMIKLATSLGTVVITGDKLDIPKYAEGELTVRGDILSVGLLKGE